LVQFDQWLLVWIGPKIRETLAAVAGREVAPVHMTTAGEFLFTGPHGVRWREVHPFQPQVRTGGFTGRAGKVTAAPDITGLDEKAHERLLGLADYSTTLHGVFNLDSGAVFGPPPAARQVVITPEGGDPVEGVLINPRVAVDHDDDGQTTVEVVGEIPQEFAERLKNAAGEGGDSDDRTD
jgi:hypothetical protein